MELIDTDIFADAAGTGGAAPATLTKEDYRMLDVYFGYQPTRAERIADPLDTWALELRVKLGANTWLRRQAQPSLAIHLDGGVDIRKTPGDSIQIFGTVEALPERSYFAQFGRRFDVTSGRVTFRGPMMDWKADFKARYTVPSVQDATVPEVVITIGVTGGMNDLALTLGGEPAMETADVLSYLATGRPAANAAEFGGGGSVGALGESLAAGQLASIIEGAAKKSVGLDVIEIRQSGFKGATVVAGRYVSPRLFVGFEQPLTLQHEENNQSRTVARETEVQLEYQAYRWLMASLQGGQSNFQMFFRVRRAF
jgi:translocation and assembly module TamB